MRLLLAALLTLITHPLTAEEFDFRGIPADAAVVMGVSNTQDLELSKHPSMLRLRERMLNDEKASARKKNVEKVLREELGLDLQKDFHSLALGLAIGKPPAVPGAEAELKVSAVLHGSFDAEKFKAFAEKRNLKAVTSGARTGWSASEFIAAVTGETPPRNLDSALFVYDSSTVVMTKLKDAEACFASLAGKNPAYALPAVARAVVPATGKVYGLIFVDATLLPSSPDLEKSGFRNGVLMLSEQGAQQVYRLSVGFADAEKAKQASVQMQGLLGMAPMFMMPTPKDAPDAVRMKKIVSKILSGFEPVKLEGDRTTVGLKVENTDMVELVECLYDFAQAQQAQQAAKSAVPTPPAVK